MKSITEPVFIAVFCISLSLGYSQDNASGDISDGARVIKEDTGSGLPPETKTESDPGSQDKTETVIKDVSVRNTGKEKKTESPKKGEGSREKYSAKSQGEEKEAGSHSGSFDGELLQINEGDFKYKRIPDIKLPERQVEMAGNQNADSASDESGKEENEGGFWGMSKTTADIFVKGGIILFILIIFILYKSRMKGSGGGKSGRKVLNSYRK